MTTEEFKALVSRAFTAARQTGKRDWHRMTVAVLKNRILQMTERKFDEKNFGANSFLELVARYGDVMAIDRTTKPPTVEWCQYESSEASIRPSDMKIRSDLWKAILDYTSGMEYEWDPSINQARAVDRATPSHRLPSIDRETMIEWRAAFEEQSEAVLREPDDKTRLRAWVENNLGTHHLPRGLQGAWNATLKENVKKILVSWFESTDFVAPAILSQMSPSVPVSPSGDIRMFVHQCVDVMTLDELRSLPISAQVSFRVCSRGG